MTPWPLLVVPLLTGCVTAWQDSGRFHRVVQTPLVAMLITITSLGLYIPFSVIPVDPETPPSSAADRVGLRFVRCWKSHRRRT